jgi:hypothetical protein
MGQWKYFPGRRQSQQVADAIEQRPATVTLATMPLHALAQLGRNVVVDVVRQLPSHFPAADLDNDHGSSQSGQPLVCDSFYLVRFPCSSKVSATSSGQQEQERERSPAAARD